MTDLQVQRLWEGMLLSEMRSLYFADLAARYNAHQRYATWAIMVATSGTFAALVAPLHDQFGWLPPLLAFGATALSYYLVATQNQRRAVDASELHYKWAQLAAEYQAIWD